MLPQQPPAPSPQRLLALEPVRALLSRCRGELAADFGTGKPVRLSRAPGRLDVMGGIADYTGSLVCEMPLACAAGVALSERDDRFVQCFSFNLFDAQQPFTLRIPLDALAKTPPAELRREFDEPGRRWAGYLAGCLAVVQQRGLIDLSDGDIRGVNLAVLSDVPLGAGVSSSAAIEVATMMNLLDHFALLPRVDAMEVAAMCQEVENHIVGAPCGIMDQVTSCRGEAGKLLRLVCRPHDLQAALAITRGMKFIGINSGVKHSVGGGAYTRTRCAAFMAHKIILEMMRQLGQKAGRELVADPMRGYLANLDPDDYKQLFRPQLPEQLKGGAFLLQYGGTSDAVTKVLPDEVYPVRGAADHHVLEAMRVRSFVDAIEKANAESDMNARGLLLDQAGHLMYASHRSYGEKAQLGAAECDLIVDLVRQREKHGLYGAKITGGGSGGTVAILMEDTPRADAAIEDILATYAQQTKEHLQLIAGTSEGAWRVGTGVA